MDWSFAPAEQSLEVAFRDLSSGGGSGENSRERYERDGKNSRADDCAERRTRFLLAKYDPENE